MQVTPPTFPFLSAGVASQSGLIRPALIHSRAFGDARAWYTAWSARGGFISQRLATPEYIPLEDLIHRADVANTVARSAAAILLCDSADPPALLLQAAARLRESGVPAMILRRACSPEDRRRLAMTDLEVHDSAADPTFLVGMLVGLVRARMALSTLEAELELAQRSHRQAELWLHRADDEMRLAARLQRDMLPHAFPVVTGLEFGACYRSAYYVGGDVYRVWRLDEHRIGLFIADAMGHGVRAAMQSMILAHALVLKEIQADGYHLISPSQALARVNHELLREHHEIARFATAVAAVIDSRTGEVELASAGHPPPLILGGPTPIGIEESGPALGAFDDAEFPLTRFTLERGRTLVLHTDGLDAAVSASRGLDPLAISVAAADHVAELLAMDHARPLADTLAALETRLDGLQGSLNAADDVAVLAVRRNEA